MRVREILSRIIFLLVLTGLPAGAVVYQSLPRDSSDSGVKVIDLVARASESGGWQPETIRVNKGDRVRLRIHGQDVVHGFAIGRMGVGTGRILPGETVSVEFTADQAGYYTYYCTVWCSPSHPRMRGTLEIVDADAEAAPAPAARATGPVEPAMDGPHDAEFYPLTPPSGTAGRELVGRMEVPGLDDFQDRSPSGLFSEIRDLNPGSGLSDGDIWDLVAYLWLMSGTAESRALGKELYARNCLACHGQSGKGDGPGSRYVEADMPDFTDARSAAGVAGSMWYAKIRRGGMGTGMPYWGNIFTDAETQSLVDYLWTFVFGEEVSTARYPSPGR